jgi:hypothetical protein
MCIVGNLALKNHNLPAAEIENQVCLYIINLWIACNMLFTSFLVPIKYTYTIKKTSLVAKKY